MEVDAVLEANKNLSEKVTKLEKELSEMRHFKERFERQYELNGELIRRLQEKRTSVRVVEKKGNIYYVCMITKLEDSPEGMFIEIQCPTKEDREFTQNNCKGMGHQNGSKCRDCEIVGNL
ncbi:MAG TPA: hypothetical protein VF941_14270 [Clostridia bacterium]